MMTGFLLDKRYQLGGMAAQELESLRETVYGAIRRELQRLSISAQDCVIGMPDAGDDGVVCFHDENGMWVFYIAERGKRCAPAFFSSAWDGANYLIWYLAASPYGGNGDVGRIPRAIT
ncbi:hypothetical protein [Variovorax sp. MHTC-1]|uniref:hypothetical protein n=1 Tax=Variovorax sp. MHTC-1 TaxID=2495593 RepID=UPI000F85D286|nr:hypothetical protein [Variovorax sp. MHTC-1]RST50677.1 hypothetical protein EJI01_21395 [Variovorax sp. MHTC-1]